MAKPDRPRPMQDQPRPQPSVPVAGNQALTVGPGQTLILTVDKLTSPEYVGELAKQVKERLPGVEVVVIAGVEQMAVYDGTPGDA